MHTIPVGKRIPFVFLFFLLCFVSTTAQTVDFNNYTPIQSSGSLPDEFTITSSEKYRQSKKTISRKERRAVRKAKDEFYLKSSFGLDDFLKSGKVLFNDPVGEYVNKVFDKVVEADNEVDRSAVKLFVVRTNYSNAFATDQGIIFITTGLLARLQNEAQLAFALSHELVHYKKKHSMDVFVQAKTIRGDLKTMNSGSQIFSKAAYSKEKETEADEEGLEIFLKTSYSPQAAVSVFDVLHYSYLPFSSEEFNREFFGGPFRWLNSSLIKNTKKVFTEEDEDDSKSTHPNTFKRKELITSLVKGEGKDYLVSENEFINARKICRFEYCRNALLELDYSEAIYAAYSLLKEEPQSIYLKKIIAKSLYSMATYYNQAQKKELRLNYTEEQGPSQRVIFFFYKLHAYELNTLAVYYLWELNKKYPGDEEITALLDKTMYWQAYLHYSKAEKSEKLVGDSINDPTVYAVGIENEDKKNIIKNFNEDSLRLLINNRVFNTLLADEGFLIQYKTVTEKARTDKKQAEEVFVKNSLSVELQGKKVTKGMANENFIMDYAKYAAVKKWKKTTHYAEIRKQYTGLFNNKLKHVEGEKVVFLNPIYYRMDERKEIPIRYEASEKTRDVFIDRLKEGANAAKVPLELYAENKLTTGDAELLNNIVLLKEWSDEIIAHEETDIIATDQAKIKKLSGEIGGRYLCFAGNIYTIYEKEYVAQAIVLSILLPIYLPYTLPYLLNKDVETNYFLVLFDLEQGEISTGLFSSVKVKNKQDISLATYYDFMQKIKLQQQYNK